MTVVYFELPCYVYAFNCNSFYLAIPGTRPSLMRERNLLVYDMQLQNVKFNFFSNKHETGLVFGRGVLLENIASFLPASIKHAETGMNIILKLCDKCMPSFTLICIM